MKLKSFLQLYFIGLAALLIINACSIKKRVYRAGYNIEWAGSQKTPFKIAFTNTSRIHKIPQIEIRNPLAETVTASNSNSIVITKTPPFILTEKLKSKNTNLLIKNAGSKIIDDCDTIIFKNGLKIKAKVLELSLQEIKYKMCDNLDGPTFTKNASDVTQIKYANGLVTEITPVYNTTTNQNSTSHAPNGTSGGSELTALLLCIFLGFLGVHRFYLGYYGVGILMLLTGGCCGILWIVDFIRILIGDLQPKDGEYAERL